MERLSPPAQSPDWTVRAADTIESAVATVRDRTVVPATFVAKALVYGIVAGFVGLVAAALFSIAVIRLLNAYAFPDWLSTAIVGGILTSVGLLLIMYARSFTRATRTP